VNAYSSHSSVFQKTKKHGNIRCVLVGDTREANCCCSGSLQDDDDKGSGRTSAMRRLSQGSGLMLLHGNQLAVTGWRIHSVTDAETLF
jgi:hypothetical protein